MLVIKKWVSEERLAALVLLLGQLAAAGGAVLVNILAAKVLTPSDRGDLAFGLQIAYFLTVFATMGLERPYMASREGAFNQEYRNFTRLVSPGVILIVPVVILALYWSHLGGKWVILGIFSVVGYTALNTLSRGVRVGYVVSGDWKKFGIYTIATQLVIIVGSVLMVALEVRQPEVWMGIYLISTMPAIVMLFHSIRNARGHHGIEPKERESIRKKGFVLLPSDFSNTAMMRIDRLLLPILGSSAQLGLYVTVATVVEMASWPVKQWVDASLRKWAVTGHELTKKINRILMQSLLFISAVTVILSLASYGMIVYVLPAQYSEAVSVIVPLAVGSVVFGLTRVQQGVLVALGATARVSVIEMIGTFGSVTALLILIPEYGMIGAAYGTILGYIVCLLAGQIVLGFLRKELKKK